MILQGEISKENFGSLLVEATRLREDIKKQDEALADIGALRNFAFEEGMVDEVTRLYLEEGLIWQHKYMAVRDGREKGDVGELLTKYELAVTQAKEYREGLSLPLTAVLLRHLGKIHDLKENYAKAMEFYGLAVEAVAVGNEHEKLEYRGFIALSEMRLGDWDKGIADVKQLVSDYEVSEEGARLKQRDYTTWVIWRSGLLINAAKILLKSERGVEYRYLVEEWLQQAEKDLVVPDGVSVWSEFGFRKLELSRVRELL